MTNARKRRTREHVLAGLAINFLERLALRCGWAVDPVRTDYGIDAMLFTYAPDGSIESGVVWIQSKASDAPEYGRNRRHVGVRCDTRDIRAWLDEPLPVILVIYDGRREQAFWLTFTASSRVSGSSRQRYGCGSRSVTGSRSTRSGDFSG